MKTSSRHRWFVVVVFFIFMLLHQSDRLLIGPLTEQIKADFKINDFLMGTVSTGALIIGAVLYPLWGYLYDRYVRSKLVAAASFIWGSTTILNTLAHTYPIFLITRASTGIDDSSYPGLYSMISDYFEPKVRGRIYGLLQLTSPIGYLIGMILAIVLGGKLFFNGVEYAPEWRRPFYLTGALGILMAVFIFFLVKEPPRGKTEPEMADIELTGKYRFNWATAWDLFKKPSLVLIFIQGFFGVFPWNAITFWFFAYLERERGYSGSSLLITMALAVVVLAAGYPLGGALGDALFQRTPRGRIIIATIGVIVGAILLGVTLNVPVENRGLFLAMLLCTAIFIPFPSSNVTAAIYDITLPEVRSTANAVESFLESTGAALSPMIIGIISDQMGSLKSAFLIICLSTWALCAFFFFFVAHQIPGDIKVLRDQMRLRADLEKSK